MNDCKVCIHYDCCCGWTSKEVIDSIEEAVEEGTCRECNYYEPKKIGKWIDIPAYGGSGWQIDGRPVQPKSCSACGDVYSKAYNYCPRCGARMIKEN